ncbi:MAG: C1 family peptidase, partial [Pseudomonadota bacterium]
MKHATGKFIVICFCLLSIMSCNQPITISGNIMTGTGGGIENVKVTLSPTAQVEFTDNTGAFFFSNVAPGSYEIKPELAGYEFDPPSYSITVSSDDYTVDFVGTPTGTVTTTTTTTSSSSSSSSSSTSSSSSSTGAAKNTGLDWTQNEWDNTESDINLGVGSGTLPAKVDMSDKFPPIGDQGQTGTCVSWAVGYNLKSYLEGIDKGSVPTTAQQQFSPKFLFWMVADSEKGDNCNGSQFEANFDVLQKYGAAKLSTVPFQDLGTCRPAAAEIPQAWKDEAASYMIEAYRKIDHTSLEEIKTYLADSRPVVIGAKLGDSFMNWTGTGVLSSDTYNYAGQHAYHAMIIVGYDDSKNAFLIRNSWGTGWGSSGTI